MNQMRERERERDGGLLFVYNNVNEYIKTKTRKQGNQKGGKRSVSEYRRPATNL